MSRDRSNNSAPRRRQPARKQTTSRATTRPHAKQSARDSQRQRPRAPQRSQGVLTRVLKTLAIFVALLIVALGVTGCAVYRSMSSQLPDPDLTKARGQDQTTVILDSTGKTLVRLFAEENRQVVDFDAMPQHLKQAVIATEDKRFYEHEGVDPIGITRALVVDVIKGERAQGGSTITQQYVKQAFVTSERTIQRKIKEAILAQRVERRYSKDEILGQYLNTIYFGHGAYGVEAAARAYFGHSVKKLTLPEAAMIAGVIKSPRRYSPYLEPEAALVRRNVVLNQMAAQGYITAAELAEAKASPIELAGLKPASTKAPYFVEWIKAQLIEEFGEQMVYRGGLRVATTLDPKAQSAAEKAIKAILNKKDDPSAALVAVRPGTGEVLAMVGGRDFETQQYNVAVQGRRQPGSAFKTFVLATALDAGINPERAYKSSAMKLAVGDQTWSVTGKKAPGGKMRLRQATEQSVNSVYAQLVLEVGAAKTAEFAQKMGIETEVEPVPAIALGGLKTGVSPLEMANAYATLAAGGTHAEVLSITSVEGPDGEVLMSKKPKTERVMDEAVAFLTTDILKGVITKGTGTAAAIGRPAAGKTGTTQKYRDAWFVGYTPDIATAVWVGHADSQREMTSVHGRAVTGGSFPAQIWSKFMQAAHAKIDEHSFERPDGLTKVKVCSETGGLATEFCPKTVSALVLAKHKPDECDVHTEPIEVKIPKLVGLTKEAALGALQELELEVNVIDKPVAGVAEGIVAEQKPAAGKMVQPKSTVTIVVSTGAAADQPPVAIFTPPTAAKVGTAVEFDGSASTDDGSITTYYWEFGDGSTGSGKKVGHTYETPGSFDVTLWVTDNSGKQHSLTKTITVK